MIRLFGQCQKLEAASPCKLPAKHVSCRSSAGCGACARAQWTYVRSYASSSNSVQADSEPGPDDDQRERRSRLRQVLAELAALRQLETSALPAYERDRRRVADLKDQLQSNSTSSTAVRRPQNEGPLTLQPSSVAPTGGVPSSNESLSADGLPRQSWQRSPQTQLQVDLQQAKTVDDLQQLLHVNGSWHRLTTPAAFLAALAGKYRALITNSHPSLRKQKLAAHRLTVRLAKAVLRHQQPPGADSAALQPHQGAEPIAAPALAVEASAAIDIIAAFAVLPSTPSTTVCANHLLDRFVLPQLHCLSAEEVCRALVALADHKERGSRPSADVGASHRLHPLLRRHQSIGPPLAGRAALRQEGRRLQRAPVRGGALRSSKGSMQHALRPAHPPPQQPVPREAAELADKRRRVTLQHCERLLPGLSPHLAAVMLNSLERLEWRLGAAMARSAYAHIARYLQPALLAPAQAHQAAAWQLQSQQATLSDVQDAPAQPTTAGAAAPGDKSATTSLNAETTGASHALQQNSGSSIAAASSLETWTSVWYSPTDLSRALHALSMVGPLAPTTFWSKVFATTLPLLFLFSASDMALLLRAVAVQRPAIDVPRTWALEVLWQLQLRLGDLNGQQLVSVLSCVADLQFTPSEEWVGAYQQMAKQALLYLSPQQLTQTLWSLARLGFLPSPTWLREYMRCSRRRLKQYPAACLAKTMHAFGLLQWLPAAHWVQSFLRCLMAQLAARSMSASQLAVTSWALAELGVKPSLEVFEGIVSALTPHVADVDDPQVMALVITGIEKMSCAPHPGYNLEAVDTFLGICYGRYRDLQPGTPPPRTAAGSS